MTTNFNSAPYYDDYDASKNFLKILFKPSYAVQARELTQLQTALQNQISKFGEHIFKEGSIVLGGSSTYKTVSYIDVATSDASAARGLTITGTTSGADAVVYDVIQLSNITSRVFFDYTNSSKFVRAELISTSGLTSYNVIDNEFFSGVSETFAIVDSVFFVKGHFVHCPAHHIILPAVNFGADLKIGLSITESIATATTDETLLDPAQGSYNFSAPGADRYVMSLDLVAHQFYAGNDTSDVKDFVELARIESGVLVKHTQTSSYAELENTLARRTYDESGDYTVRPFIAQVKEHISKQQDLATLAVGAGKAYVKGYEFETIATTNLEVPRARQTKIRSGLQQGVENTQYFIVATPVGALSYENTSIILRNQIGDQIGIAVVRGISTDGHNFKLPVIEVKMNTNASVSSVANLTATGWSAAVVNYVKTANVSAIVPSNYTPVKTLIGVAGSDTSFTGSSKFAVNFDGTSGTITTASTDKYFIGSSNDDYVIVGPTGTIIFPAGVSGTGNTKVLTAAISGVHTVYTNVGVSNAVQKTKALLSTTKTTSLVLGNISLGIADCRELLSVTASVSTNVNIPPKIVTEMFQFNTGQTDELYDHGFITLKRGYTIDAQYDTLEIAFTYFSQNVVDGFFSVDSYTGVLDYASIPTYTSSNGIVYDLANCLDFRPRRADNSTAVAGSYGIVYNSSIVADVEYYLPRKDKLVLTKQRELSVVMGIPDDNPQYPVDLPDAMTLYTLDVPAYTFSHKDITLTYVDNRRYTMRDIGKFDKRIQRVEYYTALSYLEKQASDEYLPSGIPGLERFKTGILVDSFQGHGVGDVLNADYLCSIDKANHILRPKFSVHAFNYAVNSMTNAKLSRQAVSLPYTSTVAIENPYATSWVSVNPYAVFNWSGKLELFPSSDTWSEQTIPKDVIYNLGGENDIYVLNTTDKYSPGATGVVYNDWQTEQFGTANTGATVTSDFGDRVVDTSVIPYIRSKLIKFFGSKMKPGALMHGFFGDYNVSDYCTPAMEVVLDKAIPKGATKLVSGAKSAEIIGFNANRAFVIMDAGSADFTVNNAITITAGTALAGFLVSAVTRSDTLTTNSFGEVGGTFLIPDPKVSDAKFLAGEIRFMLADAEQPLKASTSAEASYFAMGLINTTERVLVSHKTVSSKIANPTLGTCSSWWSGGQGIQEFKLALGSDIGEAGISIVQTSDKPIRYTLMWDGKEYTSGFIGNSVYNTQLSRLSLPGVISSTIAKLTFEKTAATPSFAFLRVEAPVADSTWQFQVACVAPPIIPTYKVTPDKLFAQESATQNVDVRYAVETTDVPAGTVLYWGLETFPENGIVAADVLASTGTVTINSQGSGEFTVSIIPDGVIENAEKLGVILYTSALRDNTVLVATSATTSIVDAPLSFTLTPDKTSCNEGDKVTFTFRTNSSVDYSSYNWVWKINFSNPSTTATASDFVGSTTGAFVVNKSGTASFTVQTSSEKDAQSTENFICTAYVTGTQMTVDSPSVSINRVAVIPPRWTISSPVSSTLPSSTIRWDVQSSNEPSSTLYWTLNTSDTNSITSGEISPSGSQIPSNMTTIVPTDINVTSQSYKLIQNMTTLTLTGGPDQFTTPSFPHRWQMSNQVQTIYYSTWEYTPDFINITGTYTGITDNLSSLVGVGGQSVTFTWPQQPLRFTDNIGYVRSFMLAAGSVTGSLIDNGNGTNYRFEPTIPALTITAGAGASTPDAIGFPPGTPVTVTASFRSTGNVVYLQTSTQPATKTVRLDLRTGSASGPVVASSNLVSIANRAVETYSITPLATSIPQNAPSALFQIASQNVVNPASITNLTYVVVPESGSSKFVSLTGPVHLNSGSGAASLSIGLTGVAVPTPISFQVKLMKGATQVAVSQNVYIQADLLSPTISVTPRTANVVEGDQVVFDVQTTDIASGNNLSWSLSSNFTAGGNQLSSTEQLAGFSSSGGYVTTTNGSGQFIVYTTASGQLPKRFTVTVQNGSTTGTSATVYVNSLAKAAYNITADKLRVLEGDMTTFTVTGINLTSPQNLRWETEFYTSIGGTNSPNTDDFRGITAGNIMLYPGSSATINVSTATDMVTESDEMFRVHLFQGAGMSETLACTSEYVTIVDTTVVPPPPPPPNLIEADLIMPTEFRFGSKEVMYLPYSPVVLQTMRLGGVHAGSIRLSGNNGLRKGIEYRIVSAESSNPDIKFCAGVPDHVASAHSVPGSSTVSMTPYNITQIGQLWGFDAFTASPPGSIGPSSVTDPIVGKTNGNSDTISFGAFWNPTSGVSLGPAKSQTVAEEWESRMQGCNVSFEAIFHLEYVRGDDSIPTEHRSLIVRQNCQIRVSVDQLNPYDPLAQTFFVNADLYPNGMFVDSVDLFFRNKSTTEPIEVQLRRVVNGYPEDNKVLPYSRVLLQPSEVSTSANGTVATKFTFDRPIMLPPGEHAFVVVSNSKDYEVFTSVIGEYSLSDPDQRVTTQPLLGSLFKSQNASTWTAVQEEDIKFRLNRCVFDTSVTGTVVFDTAAAANYGKVPFDTFFANGDSYDFAGTNINYFYKSSVDADWVPYQIGSNVDLAYTALYESLDPSSLQFKVEMTSTDSTLSPVVDIDRSTNVLIKNIINTTAVSEWMPYGGNAAAKYITRPVTLNPGFEATDLKVFLAAKVPADAEVRVYYKVSRADQISFADNRYIEMIPESSAKSSTQYLEYKYRTANDNALPSGDKFNVFSIKVVMLSSNSTKIPLIKDLRVIAVDD